MTIEFFPQPNIILQIGSLSLYFYGAMYALSGISAYFLLKFWVQKKNLNISSDALLDLVFWTLLSGVLGGRIFYMLVYNFPVFIENPFSLFSVWNGGMSIHGGLLGGSLGFILYCLYKKFPLGKLADIAVVAIVLGMAFGRLANFVNGELVGRITDVSWGVDFGDGENRHPSQLYAMGKDILLFIIFSVVLFRYEWKQKSGIIFASFLMMYALFRFCVEFFRAPDPQIGFLIFHLTMGQLLSIALFFIGCIVFLLLKRKTK